MHKIRTVNYLSFNSDLLLITDFSPFSRWLAKTKIINNRPRLQTNTGVALFLLEGFTKNLRYNQNFIYTV